MSQLIAAAMERLALPTSEQCGQTMINHDAEIAAGMAAVRNPAALQDTPERHLPLKNQRAGFFAEAVQMNADGPELDG